MSDRKIAFITGATRGIGKEIALELSKNGFDVALNYRKETEDMPELKKQIESNGAKCFFTQGDVSNFEDCTRMAEEIINEFGRIDVLVNNAGLGDFGNFSKTDIEKDLTIIDTNIAAMHIITKLYLQDMK